jgi:hypothetical protein
MAALSRTEAKNSMRDLSVFFDQCLADPKVAAEVAATLERFKAEQKAQTLAEQQKATQVQRVREQAMRAGFRIMHRRRGQYWLFWGQTLSLDDIAGYLSNQYPETDRQSSTGAAKGGKKR